MSLEEGNKRERESDHAQLWKQVAPTLAGAGFICLAHCSRFRASSGGSLPTAFEGDLTEGKARRAKAANSLT